MQDSLHIFGFGILALLALVGLAALALFALSLRQRKQIPQFLKRPTIFDSKSEFALFSILLELYGERYFVFPELNYSHIVTPNKDLEHSEQFRLFSRINRKSADFVICDRKTAEPLLVIELDGESHDYPRRQERDRFINELLGSVNLPICHLYPKKLTKDLVRTEIGKVVQL